ncbi:MAG: DUF1223 domain-containing protein [Terriglobales bacterium]
MKITGGKLNLVGLSLIVLMLGGSRGLALGRSLSGAGQSGAGQGGAPAQGAASPVLVELFTSEGCSSCPPADELLGKLDGQPIPGAQVIVLSEHVDYWDHEGWKDAYSSHALTERQEEYEKRFSLKSTYTPQMVVDGAAQMNGSNGPLVGRAIDGARGHAKVPVQITAVAANGKTLRVKLEVGALPADFKAKKAEVYVVVALDHAESHVSSGENKGQDIRHVAVVESMDKVGTVERGKNFDREVAVKVKGNPDLANLRIVAFVQEADAGEVVGAGMMGAPIKVAGNVGR